MALKHSSNVTETEAKATSLPLALASASPRRAELLRALGLSFDVVPSEVDESLVVGSTPADTAQSLAVAKARSVASKLSGNAVLAADTIVALDGDELGKPGSAQDAISMLSRLNGRVHTVYTGVCLVVNDNEMRDICETQVTFRDLTSEEIEKYVASGSPLDKAGAYGIQDSEFSPVKSIIGSYTNVVGLPLAVTVEMLRLAGLIDTVDTARIDALESKWDS